MENFLKDLKIYHIVHIDRLESILRAKNLYCDKKITTNSSIFSGSNIGFDNIKQRRMFENKLNTHPNLFVGDCVPFYYCPRSVMLYVIHQNLNRISDLSYQGGQDNIIHLESSLHRAIAFANGNNLRWVFTDSNAGSYYYQDSNDLNLLTHFLDLKAISASQWKECKEKKQAEFLIENLFPFELVERIGVKSIKVQQSVADLLEDTDFSPSIEVKTDWYYY
ncbi:MAG: DUF4433 domain-containing protein [Bacteriovoracaceae bacterium]|nr:DUF4433 domain-containing protein [Bacteriovoracaceae bacterium]